MESGFEIKLAENIHYAGMLEVYKPNILNSAISFEYEVPGLDEFATRINNIGQHYPCLVCLHNNEVTGYAYAGVHRVRSAYQWSVESTIYLAPDFQGRGVARVLYETLLSVLELQGFVNVYAGVTLPNEKSERFHLAMGFAEIAVFEKIGYKFGKWHDLKFFEMYLMEHPVDPAPPLSILRVKETAAFADILIRANEALNE